MLELRPNCEHCNIKLPVNSEQAMICSFECTFCQSCVEQLLKNVCPNCGGGFSFRPIRPHHNWKNGNHLQAYPASTKNIHQPVNEATHKDFIDRIKNIAPSDR